MYPYNKVQAASQKAEKHNKLILENFVINLGIKGVSIVPAIEYVLIIYPNNSSLRWSFSPKVGNKGDTKE